MSTHKYLLYPFVLLILCCLALPAVAQQNELNKEVQVTREYDPTVSDANKIDMPVQRNDTLTSLGTKFQYHVLPVNITTSYNIRPISAAKVTEQAYVDPHFVYLRAGLGYPQTILGDFYINNIRPSNLSLGAFYNLRSLHGDISNKFDGGKDIPTDDITHNAGIFVRNHFENSTLSFDAGFNQHRVLFYGYDNMIHNRLPNYEFMQDSVAQVYNSFDGKLNFMSNKNGKDADFTYNVSALFNLFQDNSEDRFNTARMFSMKEMAFGAELGLSKKITDNHGVAFNADVMNYSHKLNYNERYNMYPTDTRNGLMNTFPLYAQYYGALEGTDLDQNRINYNVSPAYIYTNNGLRAQIGVTLNGNTNELGKQKTNVYPNVNVSYAVSEQFALYAGAGGYNEVNSYKKIAGENPYILPGLAYGMKNSSHAYEAKVGFEGNVQNIFSYNVYATYSGINDMYFYRNTSTPVMYDSTSIAVNDSLYNNFDVMYDDAKELKLVAEMSVNYRNVRSGLKLAYRNYSLDTLDAAYHRPAFTADFTTDVTIARYLIISANVYAQSKTRYFDAKSPDAELSNDAFIDLGLGAEYLFNRNFSVFVNASNLLGKKYERYHQYRVPGIRVLGGLTLKF